MPTSQVEVSCPWTRGLQPQWHPKAEEHPQAYQPATQQCALKVTYVLKFKTFSRLYEPWRINKSITKGKRLWSLTKFFSLILYVNVWRTGWRICVLILGLKGLKTRFLLASFYCISPRGWSLRNITRSTFFNQQMLS